MHFGGRCDNPESARPVIQVKTRLVPVAVTVTDKDGRPVSDLRAEDFLVWDEDTPRGVKYFQLELLEPNSPASGGDEALRRQPTLGISRSGCRSILILMGRGGVNDPFNALDDLIRFVREGALPQDRIAVMAYNRASEFTTSRARTVTILQRYSAERPRIEASLLAQSQGNALAAVYGAGVTRETQARIDRIFGVEGGAGSLPLPEEMTAAQPAKAKAHRGQGGAPLVDPNSTLAETTLRDPELNEMASGRLCLKDPFDLQQLRAMTSLRFDDFIRRCRLAELDLHSLYAAVSYLRYMESPKYILYFSDQGLPLPRAEDDNSLIALANDAQVTIYAFQTGGLPQDRPPFWGGSPTLGARALGSVGRDDMNALSSLRNLAKSTGGQVSIHADVAGSIARMDALTRCTYVLGYEPEGVEWNGRFRHIRVEVKRPGLTVAYREGYFAHETPLPVNGEEFLAFSRIASVSTYSRDLSDVRFKLDHDALPGSKKTAGRQVRLTIDVESLMLPERQSIRSARLYIGIYYEKEDAKDLALLMKPLDIEMNAADFQRALQEGIQVELAIPAASSKAIEAVIYDVANDKLGTRATEAFRERWRQSLP